MPSFLGSSTFLPLLFSSDLLSFIFPNPLKCTHLGFFRWGPSETGIIVGKVSNVGETKVRRWSRLDRRRVSFLLSILRLLGTASLKRSSKKSLPFLLFFNLVLNKLLD